MSEQPTLSNWLSILALGVIWGGTFMVVSIALQGYGPLTVACARTTLGAVALLGVVAALGRPMPRISGPMVGYLIVIGLLNTALPFSLLAWGQQYVSSAFAGLTMAALPLFVLPMAHLMTDERMTSRNTLGVVLGFCGALILIGPGLASLGTGVAPLAQLACLAAAVCYAIASVLTRRCPPIDPIALAALALCVGAVPLIPAMLIVEGTPELRWDRATLAIIILGLVPTGLAAMLRVMVIRSAGSIFMTLVNYQVPVWSMIFGALVLSEALPWRFFAALALIFTGLIISQWLGLRTIVMPKAPQPKP